MRTIQQNLRRCADLLESARPNCCGYVRLDTQLSKRGDRGHGVRNLVNTGEGTSIVNTADLDIAAISIRVQICDEQLGSLKNLDFELVSAPQQHLMCFGLLG